MKNRYKVLGDTIEMEITRRNGDHHIVLFDTSDLKKVAAYSSWHISSGRNDKLFVASSFSLDSDPRGSPSLKHPIILSRLVAGTSRHLECCNLNGNTLDCRKSNLCNRTTSEKQYKKLQPVKNRCIIRQNNPDKPWVVRAKIDGFSRAKSFATLAEATAFRDQLDIAREKIRHAMSAAKERQAIKHFKKL